jgi:hypothetical protein
MRSFTRIFVFFFTNATVQVACAAEWKLVTGAEPLVAAAFKHDDGGELAVICDTRTKLISLGITEPRASWQPGAPVRVVTQPDSSVPLGQSGQPDGIALKPTIVVVKNPATLHLASMALSNAFFTLSFGDYARVFPIAKFKNATDPVLRACGDHW